MKVTPLPRRARQNENRWLGNPRVKKVGLTQTGKPAALSFLTCSDVEAVLADGADGDEEDGRARAPGRGRQDHVPRLDEACQDDGDDPPGHEAAVVGRVCDDRVPGGEFEGATEPESVGLQRNSSGVRFRVFEIYKNK